MLKSVHIHNFQSHKDTTIDLSNGVNVFIGKSDAGKTALFRAINWVLTNRPGGNAFIRHGESDCHVEITTTDNHTVKRAKNRTGTTNNYVVDGTELNSIGTDVPVEVQQVLNIDFLNVQNQLDPPFLLSESSGQVARHLNAIANMDVIDVALKNITSKQRDNKRETTDTKNRVAELEISMSEFDYLDDMRVAVEEFEAIRTERTRVEGDFNALDKLIKAVGGLEEEIAECQQDIAYEPYLDEAIALHEAYMESYARATDLQKLCRQIEKQVEQVEMDEQDIKALPLLDMSIGIWKEKQEKEQEALDISKICATIIQVEAEMGDRQKRNAELETVLANEMPDVCPLCGK